MPVRLPIRRFGILLVLSLAGILFPADSHAQMRSEYRAFWVDTFNTSLGDHDDIVAVVQSAKAALANALFAQRINGRVRRTEQEAADVIGGFEAWKRDALPVKPQTHSRVWPTLAGMEPPEP